MTKRPRGHASLRDLPGTLASAAREAAEDQGLIQRQCKFCKIFFAAYQCAAAKHLECDCPKCQGYCKCQ
jgi:hypothetical protein